MGIRGKLVTVTVLLSLLAGVVPVLMTFGAQRRSVYLGFEERGEIIAESLSDLLASMQSKLGSMNDTATVIAALKHRDVIAAYAVNRSGLVINDGTKNNEHHNGRLPQLDDVRSQITKSRDFVNQHVEGHLHVSGPVMVNNEIAGYVHVVVSLNRARNMVGHINRMQLYSLLAILALISGVSFRLYHMSCKPLKDIIDGMDAIKEGQFGFELNVRTHDELGTLAEQINEVAANLRATTISKRYLDEVLQSMADSLVVVDTDANIVTVNRATVDMLGYAEKQLVGQPASLICIDEGFQLTGARLDHLLGSQTQQDYEVMYRAASGSLIPISFSGSPIRDNSGEVVGYVCIGKNIAERKRAQVERDRLNHQLVETSRQAGMAEVATGVLHNVGNVLNSVNMSATIVVDQVKRSKISGLGKAVGMLKENEEDLATFLIDDTKGKQLPGYLSQLTDCLVDEQAQIIGELDSLTKNINHIKEIITMQQSYSKVADMTTAVNLSELLDEALRLNVSSLERHGIKVERSVAYVPSIKTDKHKVLQVLVNLVSNAKDAMLERDSDAVLNVRLRLDADEDMVRIEVFDNGCGIPEENLTKIFTHGFTTKENGHGFGLHSAALAATELGGSLTADSDGLGAGARFTLSLPLKIAEVTA